jgi:hypothetical protein
METALMLTAAKATSRDSLVKSCVCTTSSGRRRQ